MTNQLLNIYQHLDKAKLRECGRGLHAHTINMLRMAKILEPESIIGDTISDWIFYNSPGAFRRFKGIGQKSVNEIAMVRARIIGLVQTQLLKIDVNNL